MSCRVHSLAASFLLAVVPIAAEEPATAPNQFLVSTAELAEAIEAERGWVVLHVSRLSASNYIDEGHIPGARFLHWRDITTSRGDVINELPAPEELVAVFSRLGVSDEGRIVLYDDDDGLAAARTFLTLDYLGHGDRTALLDGQLAKWKAEERPLSRAPIPWEPTTFTATPRPEIIASLQEVQGILREPGKATLVDARGEAEFRGERQMELVPRAGHIPGACNVPSSSNLAGAALPVFRRLPELEALYPTDGPLVVYCRTGGQASMAYFTARMLGREVKLYDGSYSEWSQQEETPIVAPAAEEAK